MALDYEAGAVGEDRWTARHYATGGGGVPVGPPQISRGNRQNVLHGDNGSWRGRCFGVAQERDRQIEDA